MQCIVHISVCLYRNIIRILSLWKSIMVDSMSFATNQIIQLLSRATCHLGLLNIITLNAEESAIQYQSHHSVTQFNFANE